MLVDPLKRVRQHVTSKQAQKEYKEIYLSISTVALIEFYVCRSKIIGVKMYSSKR